MLTPWKECYNQLRQHIKKQRHYFVNKGPSSQGYDFSSSHVWMWELDCEESWALKNWCFGTVMLEKTHESPLDCKESNQSILKEISPGCSLEGLILKLKLQYFGYHMWRVDSLEKTLMLGGIGGRRRRGRQRMRWLDGITDSMDTSLSELTFLDPSWGYQGKNTEVVCYSLLQWTTFCSELSIKTLLSWVAPHGMAHSFLS